MKAQKDTIPEGNEFWEKTLKLEPGLQALPQKGGKFFVERAETQEKFQLRPWQMAFLGSFSINSISDSVHVMRPQFTGEIDEVNVRLFCEWLVEQKLVTLAEKENSNSESAEKFEEETEAVEATEDSVSEVEEALNEEEEFEGASSEDDMVNKALLALDAYEANSDLDCADEVDSEEEEVVDESNIEIVDFSNGVSERKPGAPENRRRRGSLINNSPFNNPVMKIAACFALMIGFLKATDSVAFAIAENDRSEVYIGTRAIETEAYFSSAALPRENPRSLSARATRAKAAAMAEQSSTIQESSVESEINELQEKLDDTLVASEYFYNKSDEERYRLAVQRIAKLTYMMGEKKGLISPLKR